MIYYFETEVPINWGYHTVVAQSERKKDGDPAPRIKVYCKAVEDGDVLSVTLVNADTSQPFILFIKNVDKAFLTGVSEIQKSFYINKHEFVTNLTK